MITAIPLFIFGVILRVIYGLGSLIQFALPSWLNDGINWIMGGAGILNAFLPLYPHPEMTGLAHEMGIMTIFGWGLIMIGVLVILAIGWWAMSLFVGILPWNTHFPKFPLSSKD